MKLSQLLDYLASGELGNLNLADKRMEIKPDKIPIVLRTINRGLEDLYTRFLLLRNSTMLYSTIDDTNFELLADDLIEVLDIFINNRKLESCEYRMTAVNKFQLNYILGITDTIRVEYKAKHRTLTDLDVSLDNKIDLPSSYVNALIYFIAARLISGVANQMDGDINEGVNYERKFQDEVTLLLAQGVDITEVEEFNHFNSRGFV